MNTPAYSSASSLTPTQVSYLQNFAANTQAGRVLLGKLASANMNSTADQAIAISSTNYIIRNIVATNASVSLTLSVGGIYAAASKTTAVVANTQIFSALTASTKTVDLTINALGLSDRRTEATLYLSLTTGQGSAATADIYIYGDRLD